MAAPDESFAAPRGPDEKFQPALRILVVEDHPIVRQGYAQLIATYDDLQVCGFAASVDEARQQIEQLRPDLAIVDITLKDSHGIELIRDISRNFSSVKMLVISALDEKLFADRALDAGALGYINKQEAIDSLIDGIRAVARGEIYLSQAMAARLLQQRAGRQAGESTSIQLLSTRELEVFQFIGQGLATRDIAARMNLSPKTIERYKENLKLKLQLKSATELVQHATRWLLESAQGSDGQAIR